MNAERTILALPEPDKTDYHFARYLAELSEAAEANEPTKRAIRQSMIDLSRLQFTAARLHIAEAERLTASRPKYNPMDVLTMNDLLSRVVGDAFAQRLGNMFEAIGIIKVQDFLDKFSSFETIGKSGNFLAAVFFNGTRIKNYGIGTHKKVCKAVNQLIATRREN